jgi:hypothetical protein
MDHSVEMAHSELRSLVTKSARGAGLAWGLAEEAGWAAEWLARRSLPAGEWAAIWLAAAVEGQPGPIEFGAGLADRLANDAGDLKPEAVPDQMAAPGYTLPFLHLIATRRGAVAITDAVGIVVRVDQDGTVAFGPSWSDRACNWQINMAPPLRTTSRAYLSSSLVDCLEGLALRTTVPPSDVSRKNAGSATSDND